MAEGERERVEGKGEGGSARLQQQEHQQRRQAPQQELQHKVQRLPPPHKVQRLPPHKVQRNDRNFGQNSSVFCVPSTDGVLRSHGPDNPAPNANERESR